MRKRHKTSTIVVSCVVVLVLAIAITLGLVLGPLLKHRGPSEPITPTFNILNHYKDEKVVAIGKFAEQSLSQDIVTDDNHNHSVNADGKKMNYYIYNYRISNMATNLESIDIKAEKEDSIKNIDSDIDRSK